MLRPEYIENNILPTHQRKTRKNESLNLNVINSVVMNFSSSGEISYQVKYNKLFNIHNVMVSYFCLVIICQNIHLHSATTLQYNINSQLVTPEISLSAFQNPLFLKWWCIKLRSHCETLRSCYHQHLHSFRKNFTALSKFICKLYV